MQIGGATNHWGASGWGSMSHDLSPLGFRKTPFTRELTVRERFPLDPQAQVAAALAEAVHERMSAAPLAQAARQRCRVRTLMRTGRPSRSTCDAPATWRTAAAAGHPPSTRASTSATTE